MKKTTAAVFSILFNLFASAQIPGGSVLWLKADTGIQVNAAGRVLQWNDQSGHNNHAVALSESGQPVLLKEALNGYPVIRFDGMDDILQTSKIDLSATPAVDVYIVYRSAGNNDIILEQSADINSNDGGFYLIDHYVNSSSGLTMSLKGNAADHCGYPNGNNKQSALFTNSNSYCYKLVNAAYNKYLKGLAQVKLRNDKADLTDNGTSYYCNHTDNFSNDNIYIGGRARGNIYMLDGDIAEILIYPETLSVNSRSIVEDYLTQKYFSGSRQQFVNVSGHTDNTDLTAIPGTIFNHKLHLYGPRSSYQAPR